MTNLTISKLVGGIVSSVAIAMLVVGCQSDHPQTASPGVPIPPAISMQPSNTVVLAGTNHTFQMAMTGSGPLYYLWLVNSTNSMAMATNAQLILGPLQSGQAGSFTVVVSNQAGSITSAIAVTVTPASVAPPAVSASPVAPSVIRIKAGASAPWTDSKGNVWAADQGFMGGETDERPEISISGTTEPDLYKTEHYSMDSFSTPLANGKYLVKLHFAETFDGIGGPGQRVFSFKVQGHEFKDFDIWVKAGGPFKPYVESVPVEITDGKLLITFTPNVENPQINGIEIIPQP